MKSRFYLTATVVGLLTFAGATSAMAFTPPEVKQEGEISYITGGIGERETVFLRDHKKDYKLRVISSGPKGAFTGEVKVTIRDESGLDLLNADAGPLFYANLPNGNYVIEVRNDNSDQTLTKSVSMKGKPAALHFIFKVNNPQ